MSKLLLSAACLEGSKLLRVFQAIAPVLDRFRVDERGNIIIMAGITLPLIMGAAGAAVVYSNANSGRTQLQAALDAAVLAGVIASDTGSVQIDTAQNAFQGNVKSILISPAASFTVDGSILSGTASSAVPNPFGGLLTMSKTIAIGTKSAAIKVTTSVCVLGLNGLDNGSFDINGSKARFNANCGVQANSNSKSGMSMEGNPQATARKFGVVGGHKGDGFSPSPQDGAPNVADPYASLPFPTSDACSKGQGKKGDDIKNDTTLSPGTYCGGIHAFGNGTRVTLQPGIYIMDGGPLWTDGSAIVTGENVMIAFTGKGSTLQVWGNSTVNLTSPTSGTYMNMQFMQDRSDNNTRGLWVSVGGSAGAGANDGTGGGKLTFDGVAYFPTQNFWTFGNATLNANSPSTAIVADKIWTQGSATVNVTNENRRNLAVTAPQMSIGARLIY